MPLIYKGSLLEKVREENRGGTIRPKFTWKMAIEMEVGQYVLFRSLAVLGLATPWTYFSIYLYPLSF